MAEKRPTTVREIERQPSIELARGIAKRLEEEFPHPRTFTQEKILGFFEKYPVITVLLARIIEVQGDIKEPYENPNNLIYPSIFSGHRGERPDYFFAALYPAKPKRSPETIGYFAVGSESLGLALPLDENRYLDRELFLASGYGQRPDLVFNALRKGSYRLAKALEEPRDMIVLDAAENLDETDLPELIAV